jgi:hypothetical protein
MFKFILASLSFNKVRLNPLLLPGPDVSTALPSLGIRRKKFISSIPRGEGGCAQVHVAACAFCVNYTRKHRLGLLGCVVHDELDAGDRSASTVIAQSAKSD